jgi:NAD(P)-dependent dehydrogenase (short-subunit alcohol dehydrogenase family)
MKKQPLPPSRNAAAVVTGAGSGIGRSFAYELARRGGAVICVDINEERAEQVVASLQALGSQAIAYRCDVGDAKQMEALSDEAEKLLGRPVTLVINNAGVGLGGPNRRGVTGRLAMVYERQPLGRDPRLPFLRAETSGSWLWRHH